MASVSLLVPVLVGTIGIGLTAALLAWRERPEPGSIPLTVLLLGQGWWSATLVFQIRSTSLGAKVFWSDIAWIGVVVIPIAWFLFALEYTGRDQYVRPRYIAVLAVVPAATVVIAVTGWGYDFLYLDSELVVENGMIVLERTPGPWFWVITGYTYLLGLLGSIPLFGLVQSDALPFRGQSAALLVGTLAPWASNALFLLDAVPLGSFDPTPVAFAVSGVAYLGALTRFRLLGTSPSPNRRARRLVLERMDDGAVVVDSHDYVVDLNESGARILETAPHDALGQPAADVIPEYDDISVDGGSSENTIYSEDGKPYDVTATRIEDYHGRLVGRLITFHDVSEYVRQQQRYEVLNRVFRHNIRNETNLIVSNAELLADGDTRSEVRTIKERAMQIEETAEKARAVTDVFRRARGSPDPVAVETLVESALAAAAEYDGVTVESGQRPANLAVDSVLEPVLRNLVENAIEHNTSADPWVRIDVDQSDGRVRITVTDNGPGIDEYERAVLERGTETALEHGSGLGLWLVVWGTDIAGGEVTFDERDPTGAVVTVDVPTLGTVEDERANEQTPLGETPTDGR